MEPSKKKMTCSHCGEKGHNKRSCPNKLIDDIDKGADINKRGDINKQNDCIEENIIISDKRDKLIDDLLERQAYDIPIDIFTLWYPKKNICKQNEIRYLLDRGINKDSMKLYLDIIEGMEDLF